MLITFFVVIRQVMRSARLSLGIARDLQRYGGMSLSPELHFFIAATIIREVTQNMRLPRTIIVGAELLCGGRDKHCLASSCHTAHRLEIGTLTVPIS